MATMKYIGARYMPKFMGNYDATTAYEALSVVDNGAGTTYVANKPAPAGTPLSDTEYWSIYGASSGAILDLQNRMQTAENNITNLTGRTTANEIDIARIDAFGDLKGKKIAVFGSSNETTEGGEGIACWVDSLATMLGNYSTVVNNSVSGYTLLQSINQFISDPNRATYDIVIFASTRNLYKLQNVIDVSQPLLVPTSIRSAIDGLNTYLSPAQEVYFCTCLPYTDNKKAFPMCIYDGVVKKAAETNGFRMLDLHSYIGVSDANSGSCTWDGTHYRTIYAPIIARKVIKGLLSNGDAVANYCVKIEDTELYTYLSTYAALLSGVTMSGYTGIGRNVLYCDVNLRSYMIAYLLNNTGAIISNGSNILTTNNCILQQPVFVYHNKTTNCELNFNYTTRVNTVRAAMDIPAGSSFAIEWGNVDNLAALG